MRIDRKVHLATSYSPIDSWGKTVEAACGKPVEQALRMFTWDDMTTGQPANWSAIGNCSDCFNALQAIPKENRAFVYSMKSALAFKALRSGKKRYSGIEGSEKMDKQVVVIEREAFDPWDTLRNFRLPATEKEK